MAHSKKKFIENDTEYELLLPVESLPKEKPKAIEVALRGSAEGGDAITVRVVNRRGGRPLKEALVRMETLEGETVAKAYTDGMGKAVFIAPHVEFPTVFEFIVDAPGFSAFIPGSDGRAKRMLLNKGFTPLFTTVVMPPFFASITPSPKKRISRSTRPSAGCKG